MKTTSVLTCALPYANGNLHIGHFFEATLADICARHYRTELDINKQIQNFLFVSGADCHGAATTLYCEERSLDISSHLEAQYRANLATYKQLKISFSNFSKTNTELHKKVLGWCVENIQTYEKTHKIEIFQLLDTQSWYDPELSHFLPDRYVKGVCPHCQASGQTAEVCDNCHKVISAPDLLNPQSVISKKTVELKTTKHLTLNTQHFYEEVEKQSHLLHPSIKNKLLDQSLKKQTFLDISRDGPYYGIEIDSKLFPQLSNQYFYVWFDAPIGYLTFAFEALGLAHTKEKFQQFLSGLELTHFIGKDIAYFHTFLWLNLLKAISGGQSSVVKLNFHGWFTYEGQKFSKSLGNSFDISNWSSTEIDALRLYFFSKSDGSIEDQDFVLGDVANTYNQLIVHGLANFYSRSVKILNNYDLKIKLPPALQLPTNYRDLLNSGNYKKLFLLLQTELAQLNSEFQDKALWKCSDKELILNLCQAWLAKWYDIYLVLTLVCPELEKYKTDILQQTFIHLAQRITLLK